jgi:hypothetical protein
MLLNMTVLYVRVAALLTYLCMLYSFLYVVTWVYFFTFNGRLMPRNN